MSPEATMNTALTFDVIATHQADVYRDAATVRRPRRIRRRRR
jgi:hypothetical protein